MKTRIGFLACLMLLSFLAGPAAADYLVPINLVPGENFFDNPQWVTPNSPEVEGAWLAGLLGHPIDFISRDESGESRLDEVPPGWTYAILKYGVGQPDWDNPDHWAVYDSNFNNVIDFGDLGTLPSSGLSHVSYFGRRESVPEPASMLLFGAGLISFGVYRKIKSKKS
jgi:hypothetical protein